MWKRSGVQRSQERGLGVCGHVEWWRCRIYMSFIRVPAGSTDAKVPWRSWEKCKMCPGAGVMTAPLTRRGQITKCCFLCVYHTHTLTHTCTPHTPHTLPHIRLAMRQALQADLISLQLPHSALLITSLRNGLFICKTRFIMPSLQGWLWTLNEVFTHISLRISLGTRGRDSSHQLDLNCGSTASQLCDPGQITKFPPAFISSSVKTGREVFTFFLGLLQRLNKAVQAKGLELCLAESQHYRRVSFSYDSILLPGAFSSLHSPLPPSQLDCPSTKVFRLKPVCPIHHNLPFVWERREGEKEEERGRERRFSWGG